MWAALAFEKASEMDDAAIRKLLADAATIKAMMSIELSNL